MHEAFGLSLPRCGSILCAGYSEAEAICQEFRNAYWSRHSHFHPSRRYACVLPTHSVFGTCVKKKYGVWGSMIACLPSPRSCHHIIASSKAVVCILSDTCRTNKARRPGLPLRLVGATESCAVPTQSYPRSGVIRVLHPASNSGLPLVGATESCAPPVGTTTTE